MIVTYIVAMVKTSSACADSYIGEYIVWLLAGGQGKPEGRSARPGRGEKARGEPPPSDFVPSPGLSGLPSGSSLASLELHQTSFRTALIPGDFLGG